MINLNTYILEKLKINKDLEFDNVTSQIEDDLLEYLKQYEKYDKIWDINIGETIKDWVKRYNVKGIKVCALKDQLKNFTKLNHDFIDKELSKKEWKENEVYKSNHTNEYENTINSSEENKKFIDIWFDDYGYEVHINGLYILLQKLIFKAL